MARRLLTIVLAACGPTTHAPPASPTPAKCEATWPVGPAVRLCKRDAALELVGTKGVITRFPAAQVLDAWGDEVLLVGTCGDDQFQEYADTATCVVRSDGDYHLVYAYAPGEPNFARGAVLADAGVITTDGRKISLVAHTNTSLASGEVDEQLVAAGLKPAGSCVWTVRVPLHRAGTSYEMTFEDCAHHPVVAAVELLEDATFEFSWHRAR